MKFYEMGKYFCTKNPSKKQNKNKQHYIAIVSHYKLATVRGFRRLPLMLNKNIILFRQNEHIHRYRNDGSSLTKLIKHHTFQL